MKKTYLIIFTIISALLLTACSGEPSEQDIKKALQLSIKENNEAINSEKNSIQVITKDTFKSEEKDIILKILDDITKDIIYELVDVKKIGECVSNIKEYECEFKLTVKNSIKTSINIKKMKFVQLEDKEWIIKN